MQSVDKDSDIPRYIQIRDSLKSSIASSSLPPGARLPTVSAMAQDWGVTAATIRRALQDLVDEGLVTSHVGRGTFVADAPAEPSPTRPSTARQSPTHPGRPSPARPAPAHPDRSRQEDLSALLGLAQKPGVIAFTRGIADPLTVEQGILTRLAAEALSSGEEVFWDYGDPRGLRSLRESIASLYRAQGSEVQEDRILVTSGSQQAISLIAQQASELALPVICETPCYAGVTNAFAAFGVEVATVPRDKEGPIVSLLPTGPSAQGAILYLCPILHNPTGLDISSARRAELSEWARRNSATILSDEVYSALHFLEDSGGSARSLPSFLRDGEGHETLTLGSLSKSFISGLRVGWIVAPEGRIASLTAIKKAMDLGCPPLMQGIARAFLDSPDGYAAHKERLRNHYRSLRDVTLASLRRNMPENVAWTEPKGGFQLQIELPSGYSSVELFVRAIDRGVAFLPGPLQDPEGRFAETIRLCYGSLSAKEIESGIRALAGAIEDYVTKGGMSARFASQGDF